MKKATLFTLAAATLVFGVSAYAEEVTVGYASAALSDTFSNHLAYAWEDYIDEFPGYNVTVVDGDWDPSNEINVMNDLFAQGVDALICQPMPGCESGGMQFYQAGKPVVFVNIIPTITDDLKDMEFTYVGCSDYDIGVAWAEYFKEALPENGTCVIIENPLGQVSTQDRYDGFVDTITEARPDVQILDAQSSNADTANSMALMEDWLQRFGSDGIDCVISQSAASTAGVIEVLKANDLIGKVMVGSVDLPEDSGVDWLLDGYTTVDVVQDYATISRTAMEVVQKQLNGEETEYEYWIPLMIATAENAEEFR